MVVINFQCSADDKVVRSPLSLKKHPIASLTSWINLVIFVSWSNGMQWRYMLYWGPSVSSKRTRPISSFITMIWLNPREGKMKRVLCSDWLIDRARWLFIAGSGLPALILPKKILFGSSIDQAYSVKMAGYWRGFFCQEKRLGHYPTIFTQQERLITHISWIKALVCEGSIIKDLLYSKNNFLSLLQHSAKSRASKMGPCCPLG